jgi:phosphoribosylformylglycinamidine synthase
MTVNRKSFKSFVFLYAQECEADALQIEITSHTPPGFPQCPRIGPYVPEKFMKAKIIITPKKAVLDPQGKTVQNALTHMGFEGVSAVHVGKYIEIELPSSTEPSTARPAIEDACRRFLSNPVIEDYQLVIE